MKRVEEILKEVEEADVFLGAPVETVRSARFDGESPLHICAKWGDSEAVRVLAMHGAELGKAGEDGNTALHYAAMLGHLDTVVVLMSLGAPNSKDRYGHFPIDLAADHPVVKKAMELAGYGAQQAVQGDGPASGGSSP